MKTKKTATLTATTLKDSLSGRLVHEENTFNFWLPGGVLMCVTFG